MKTENPRIKDDVIIYFKDEKYHREDGPAIEKPNGDKVWFYEGNLHREDGPAVIIKKDDEICFYWYIHGDLKTQEEFAIWQLENNKHPLQEIPDNYLDKKIKI